MKHRLEKLFHTYLEAFLNYDTQRVRQCYLLPCTLSTPDKMLVINNSHEFDNEFGAIFEQLKVANIKQIIATNASYVCLANNLMLVCIDWAFVDCEGITFADFSAFYHIMEQDSQLKIVNVNSHSLSQSKQLPLTLVIE